MRGLTVCLMNVFIPKGQRCVWEMDLNLSYMINSSSLKASIPTNEVFMFKLTIEEHFERD